MTDILFPLAATAAAGAVTYWSCIRPMRRRGSCAHSPTVADTTASNTDLQAQLLEARAELARLRADQAGLGSDASAKAGAPRGTGARTE